MNERMEGSGRNAWRTYIWLGQALKSETEDISYEDDFPLPHVRTLVIEQSDVSTVFGDYILKQYSWMLRLLLEI